MRRLPLCVLLLAGCPMKLPGEVVGTYEVTMHLEKNTCGEQAVYLRDGDRYAVELRAEGEKGYWRLADGKPLEGERNSDEFRFAISTIVASEAGDAGPNRCQLQQDELVKAAIEPRKGGKARKDEAADAGALPACGDDDGDAAQESGDTELNGTHTLTISAAGGSDCSVALAGEGGAYEALPCVVRYSIHGTERDEL